VLESYHVKIVLSGTHYDFLYFENPVNNPTDINITNDTNINKGNKIHIITNECRKKIHGIINYIKENNMFNNPFEILYSNKLLSLDLLNIISWMFEFIIISDSGNNVFWNDCLYYTYNATIFITFYNKYKLLKTMKSKLELKNIINNINNNIDDISDAEKLIINLMLRLDKEYMNTLYVNDFCNNKKDIIFNCLTNIVKHFMNNKSFINKCPELTSIFNNYNSKLEYYVNRFI